jgi:hypothetical protein
LERFVLALNNKDEFLVKEGLLNLPVKEPVVDVPEVPVVEKTEPDVNTAPTD